MGYHASTREYAVFQDMLTFAVEELLDIPMRDDFLFLRTPGHPQFSQVHASHFNDEEALDLVLCLNYSAYSNFQDPSSCSFRYFHNNDSSRNIDYVEPLIWFYEQMGINKEQVRQIYQGAIDILGQQGPGVMLQLFDLTQEPQLYAEADQQCHTIGDGQPLSTLMLGKDASNFSEQIRMLLKNCWALNPNSNLQILRHDLLPKEQRDAYQAYLKEHIQALQVDPIMRTQFKSHLESLWQGKSQNIITNTSS